MTRLRMALAALLVTGSALSSSQGCGECAYGFITVQTACTASGGGMVDVPQGLPVADTLQVNGKCEGSCEKTAEFWFGTSNAGGLRSLGGGISLPESAGKAPFTIELGPASPGVGSFSLSDGPAFSRLEVIEGRVVVTARTPTGFEATFSATVATPAGERFVIRGGTVKVANCHPEEVCTNT